MPLYKHYWLKVKVNTCCRDKGANKGRNFVHTNYLLTEQVLREAIGALIELAVISYIRILYTGAQLGNFEWGRRYICNMKDEIIHGFIPSVKFVAPLFLDISLAKV